MPDFPGVVFVQDFDGSDGFRLDGAGPGDLAGFPVSSAGDVNGDGFDDLLIGAKQADPNGKGGAGTAHVVFGTGDGFGPVFDLSTLNGTNGFSFSGVGVLDVIGKAVSSAGDINGDGYDDIIVTSGGDLVSYVVFGGDSPFPAEILFTELDGSNGFQISTGVAVSAAGDVNGDGIDDFVVTNPFATVDGNFQSGESYVIFGSTDPFDASISVANLDGTNGFRVSGIAASDKAGGTVSSAGDVNGDGFDDIIIGASGAGIEAIGEAPSGESYVVFGKQSGFQADLSLSDLDGTNGFSLTGENVDDASSSSISSAGDINGDGFDDLIIGAPLADANGRYDAGRSYVVFGKASGFDAAMSLSSLDGSNGFAVNGTWFYDESGRSVSSAGDVNGDGFDDILIGAPSVDFVGYDNAGEAFVLFGKATGFDASIDPFSLDGSNDLDGTTGFAINGALGQFGRVVSEAGDVNGDGFDDIIVGTYGNSDNGEAYVIFGRAPTEAVTRVGSAADQKILGGSFGDTLSGLAGDDTLSGGAGNDLLGGGTGNDNLSGQDGGDKMWGGEGEDTIEGGNGWDSAWGGAGNDVMSGGWGSDRLYGQDNADKIWGGAGNDTIEGGNGWDNAWGGAGNDVMSGGWGSDRLYGQGGNDGIWGGGGNDTIDSGTGSDTLFGGLGNDQLAGGSGDDTVYGQDGADDVRGGLGDDTLFGGLGDDTFVFAAGDGDDTVGDFTAGAGSEDALDVSGFSFASLADVTGVSSQVGSDVVIALDASTSVTLLGVGLGSLHEDDFLFA